MFVFLFAESALTTVAGDELASAGEFIDRQTAAVGTAAAFCHAGRKFQRIDLVNRKHGGLIAFGVMLPCNKSGTESTHNSCDIRTNGFTAGNFFKASQYGIIIESTALHNDLFSEIGGIGYLDDFKQGILNNRICKARGNIGNGSTFLLCLFYFGVHEYGTAGSEIDRMLCEQCCFCKILYAVI